MQSIRTRETGFLQRGLLVIAALVAILAVAASATIFARHFTGSSSAAAPTTQSVGRGLDGDSASGYRPSSGQTLNGDSSSGYGVSSGIAVSQRGAREARHQ